jgi:methylmalonyl-CoA mutase cobalamin-binding domain/chain
MSQKQMALEAVTRAFGEVLGVDDAQKSVEIALENSATPTEIIQSLREGVDIVGRKYQAQEYFLSELIMAGVMAEEVTNLLRPQLAASLANMYDRIVIGTVKGDIHDIGKKLVSIMLMSAGFDVIDIGVDVAAEDFVSAVASNDPKLLALSCLLTNAMDEMGSVIAALKKAALRRSLRVLVGGRPTTREFALQIGAHGYGADAVEAVKAARDLLSVAGETRT